MAFSSNGQISYLVLDSLVSGSKYGLEIIEYISQKTNGGFVMKKPTLYSCLTRMEKKGLVSSSFWGESELGGKRHYYSITQAGRENLAELAKQLDEDDFSQPQQESYQPATVVETVEQSAKEEQTEEEKPTYLQQDNLFDLVEQAPAKQTQDEEDEENDVLENQIDMFNMEPSVQENEIEEEVETEEHEEPLPTEEEQEEEKDSETERYYQSLLEQGTDQKTEESEEQLEEEKTDDAVLLDENERTTLTLDEEAQNKRLYDTSSELKKYRKKKSFSENQIEMAVVYDKEEDDEIQKARIAELKRSLLNLKGETPEQQEEKVEPMAQYQPQSVTPNYNTLPQYNPIQEVKEEVEETEEEAHDDGKFITEPRINASDIPVARKIAPTNIEVNIYDDNLPAPKRNSELEPSYKDMMSKLFERKAERQRQPVVTPEHPIDYANAPDTNGNFVDYNSLKRYYQARNIEFKEYKKTTVRRSYNTNLLQLINSIVLFVLSGIASLALLWIVAGTHNLMSSTNFLYYTIPGLFGLYCLYALTKYKCFASKKASLRYNAFTNWMIFLLASLITLIINIACGMQFETIAAYSTSLFLPMLALLVLFPVNFYTKKLIYRRYSK